MTFLDYFFIILHGLHLTILFHSNLSSDGHMTFLYHIWILADRKAVIDVFAGQ